MVPLWSFFSVYFMKDLLENRETKTGFNMSDWGEIEDKRIHLVLYLFKTPLKQ